MTIVSGISYLVSCIWYLVFDKNVLYTKYEIRNTRYDRGFTLIELLISISIIGILAAIVLVIINPTTVRSKVRDSQRVNDLKSMQAALELYISDKGAYPVSGTTGCDGSWQRADGVDTSCLNNALTKGADKYIDSIPKDPLWVSASSSPSDPCVVGGTTRYNYITTSPSSGNGNKYVLTAILELPNANKGHECDKLPNWPTFACSGVDTTKCYGVQNP